MLTVQTFLNDHKRKGKISGWQLRNTRESRHELYFIGENFQQNIESYRCSQNVFYDGFVHKSLQDPTKIGESRFLFRTIPQSWQKEIENAIAKAEFIENPAFHLPTPYSLSWDSSITKDEELKNISEALWNLKEYMDELQKEKTWGHCKLASCEFHLSELETRLCNHTGLWIEWPSTRVLWDFVLLSEDGQFEINELIRRRSIRDLKIQETLAESARRLSEMQNATLPPTGNYPVLFTEEALDTIFDYFLTHASGSALYYGYSVFEKNKPVLDATQEATPFTLTTSPTLPLGGSSAPCDEFGFPLAEVCLIENGILKNYAIDGRLSQLLNKERTSALSNILVQPGKESINSLRETGVIELKSFSTFSPNGITGAFSGEIRYGIFHKNGKKIPIKGGSVSGMTQDIFSEAVFSKETTKRESYYGPEAIWVKSATFAGES